MFISINKIQIIQQFQRALVLTRLNTITRNNNYKFTDDISREFLAFIHVENTDF